MLRPEDLDEEVVVFEDAPAFVLVFPLALPLAFPLTSELEPASGLVEK